MRVSKEEMGKSHQRIVEGAARLFRERGVEGASVADVMSEAGLTQGGFYRHFETKEALVDAALQIAFEQSALPLESRLERQEPKAAIAGYRAHYLSDGHVRQAGIGCPVVALGADVARGLGELKRSFGAGVKRMIASLAKGMAGSQQEKEARATREFAMLVGAVVIARASDPETAVEVLAACRSAK
jgi:TetR/AcrR family transcriptional repressor of nem operon